MNEEKTKLNENDLDKVNGGYGIIHKRNGDIILVDDNGKKLNMGPSSMNDIIRNIKDYEEFLVNADKSILEDKNIIRFKKGLEWEK